MENYDPKFASAVKMVSLGRKCYLYSSYCILNEQGDILVGGFNFGTGSSREQAATSILYSGIRLVLAGSFSETFKRNAINNGLLVLEAPQLVRDLRAGAGAKKSLTQRTALLANIKLDSGIITLSNGKKYRISPVGIAAQELLVEGGLEAWVKKQI
jgi:homoaconitate hydratase